MKVLNTLEMKMKSPPLTCSHHNRSEGSESTGGRGSVSVHRTVCSSLMGHHSVPQW